MLDLVVQSGKKQGCRLTLPPEKLVIVGRDPDCQLTLASTLVSRRHCELCQLPEGIRVTDLNSQNGTYVNEVAVSSPIQLRAGDTLRIGACTFEVQVSKTPEPVPAPVEVVSPLPTPVRQSPQRRSVTPDLRLRKSRSPMADISEDNIGEWLSESDTVTDFDPQVALSTPPHVPETVAPTAPTQVSPEVTSVKPRGSMTVKEEAAEIIRRHLEQQSRPKQ